MASRGRQGVWAGWTCPRIWVFLLWGAIGGSPAISLAVEPLADAASDLRWLPDSVQGVIAVRDWEQMRGRWQQTQFGQLIASPELKTFWDSQRESVAAELSNAGLKMRLSMADLDAIASGQATLAWMSHDDSRRPYSVALIIETTGREAALQDVLTRVDEALAARQARAESMTLLGVPVKSFELPRKAGDLVLDQVLYAVTANRLFAADRVEVMEQLIQAAQGTAPEKPLIGDSDWEAVEERLKLPEDADLHWFVRPIGVGKVFRAAGGARRNRYDTDILKLLADQGFDAVRAAGGAVRINGDFDVEHRGYVYAPPVTGSPEKYKLAARILQFPNGPVPDPPGWMPADSASVMSMNWRLRDAFWATETLVDQWVGSEVFRETLRGIKEDPDGPQVDVEKDIVEQLGDRLWLVTDNQLPATPESERLLVAVALKDADAAWRAIDKAMSSDPNAARVEYNPHPIWEVRPSEEQESVDLEGFDDFGIEQPAEDASDKPPPLLSKWAVTVFDQHLMFSSHAQMIIDCIERQHTGASLPPATETELEAVRGELERINGMDAAVLRIIRTRLAWRVKYEQLRAGQLDESNSVLASILRRAFVARDPALADPNQPPIDASLLPSFDDVARFFHSTGTAVETRDDGWAFTAIVLPGPSTGEPGNPTIPSP